jgi:glycosyltransferase involved in cell wall biosynthesis
MATQSTVNSNVNLSNIGIVVIGRNEGLRLQNCLLKLPSDLAVVYVDSGSTDRSVAFARRLARQVIELDMSIPFTAARARNVGWREMVSANPHIEYIQFLDGDCELVIDWLKYAKQFLEKTTDAAIVCGRVRERHPEASIYNRLCDFEWDTPVGLTKACGGIALARVKSLQDVNGFEDLLVAGEEPEMCLRMRMRGWTIWRLDHEMALHDAAIHRFGQWWTRTKRGGFASAATASLHRGGSEAFNMRRSMSAMLWGAILPVSIVILTSVFDPFSSALALLYPLQMLRISAKTPGQLKFRLLRSVFLVVGKIPEAIGVLSFLFDQLASRQHSLIEYK